MYPQQIHTYGNIRGSYFRKGKMIVEESLEMWEGVRNKPWKE